MLVVLFTLATCVSAFLLFWVQPLIAKLLLPLLGGTPAVWNTAMMFFQLVLLGGYLYVHLLSRLRPRTQALLHGLLLLAAASRLPFGETAGLLPPTDGAPIVWLLGTLAATVGLPFFALSASAPLLQAWFGRSRDRHAADPYFLYAASNAGSLVSLLAFPVVLERMLPLPLQGRLWAGGFVALIVLFVVCYAALQRSGARQDTAVITEVAIPLGWQARLMWVALAFVPSSLLLGVTAYVSTDLASVPLLWVVPLALYLLTFIIAFGGNRAKLWAPHAMVAGLVVVTVLLVGSRMFGPQFPVWVLVPAHIGGFFAIALGCHCWLAERRPPTRNLTEFYLWVSMGGALGGVLNALFAPAVFNTTYEYDLVLVLACVLRVIAGAKRRGSPILDNVLALLLFAGVFVGTFEIKTVPALDQWGAWPPRLALLGVSAVALLWFSRRPARLSVAVAWLLVGGLVGQDLVSKGHRERSFFGVHSIRDMDGGAWVALMHGDIVHGGEATDPARWKETSSYYIDAGPAGQFFASAPRMHRVAAIGLGTGGLVCYRKLGEEWTFFEIDPAVIRIAHDTRYFHYLEQCGGDTSFTLGDGRLTLGEVADGTFDTIVLDAFSSDSIPVHLLTREAMQLYLRKLAPHGRLLVHISNRFLELTPVLAADVASIGAVALKQSYTPTPDELARWATASQWVVIAREDADLDFLRGDARWQKPTAPVGFAAWTDDFSNVLSVMRW